MESWTTGTAMLYRFDSEAQHTVWVACVGDSRAVLQTGEGTQQQVRDLTVDQKADLPEELDRIEQAGGYVSPAKLEWGDPARVWLVSRLSPNLRAAVWRCLRAARTAMPPCCTHGDAFVLHARRCLRAARTATPPTPRASRFRAPRLQPGSEVPPRSVTCVTPATSGTWAQ